MLTPEQAALAKLCVAGAPYTSPDDECVCDKSDTIVCGVGFDDEDSEVDGVLGTNTAQALADALNTIAALASENDALRASDPRQSPEWARLVEAISADAANILYKGNTAIAARDLTAKHGGSDAS